MGVKSKSEDFSMLQKLLQIVMISSCSEAACESCGSLMGQHGGINRHLEPDNFSTNQAFSNNYVHP